jgi:hypothetical protein
MEVNHASYGLFAQKAQPRSHSHLFITFQDTTMDSDREVVVSRPRSMAMSEAPERTSERTRFARLNPEIEQGIADRLFSTFVHIYGCM